MVDIQHRLDYFIYCAEYPVPQQAIQFRTDLYDGYPVSLCRRGGQYNLVRDCKIFQTFSQIKKGLWGDHKPCHYYPL